MNLGWDTADGRCTHFTRGKDSTVFSSLNSLISCTSSSSLTRFYTLPPIVPCAIGMAPWFAPHSHPAVDHADNQNDILRHRFLNFPLILYRLPKTLVNKRRYSGEIG